MIRSIKDADLIVTKELPAAGASNNSDTITLGTEPPEELQVELSVPALPSLADTKTATFTFQDSADNSSFAAIPELATLVMTGSGGAGAAAASRTVSLPPGVRSYLNVACAVAGSGGDNTAKSYTVSLKF